MTFEFATAGRILFGCGNSRQVPALARDRGRHALLVLGGSGRGRDAWTQGLGEVGVRAVVVNVSGEPTTHLVDEAAGIGFLLRLAARSCQPLCVECSCCIRRTLRGKVGLVQG